MTPEEFQLAIHQNRFFITQEVLKHGKVIYEKDNFTSDVKTWLAFAEYDLKSAKWQLEGKFTSLHVIARNKRRKRLENTFIGKRKSASEDSQPDRLVSALKK